MKQRLHLIAAFCMVIGLFAGIGGAAANGDDGCAALPDYATLRDALKAAQADDNGGFALNMWATIVDRDGVVCAVAFTGESRGDQWPGSRVISAQKANAANAFSLPGLALSTANLYSATQPGGSLYGLQHSNPVDTRAAYRGNPVHYGAPNDPMVGDRIGGVNVFGGGLAMYSGERKVVGALGVSGDTSCADHNIGWRLRNRLNFDFLQSVGGVSGDAARPDNIIFDVTPNPDGGTGKSAGGFGHPTCINTGDPALLPVVK